MQRRDVMMGAGAAIAAMAASRLAKAAEPEKKDPHAGHASPYAKLVQTTADCAAKGRQCLSHCIALLSEGDKAMGPCARSVREMTTLCEALGELAAADSPKTKDLAKLAARSCKDCEAECRKHEKLHAICKLCADSCAACADECSKAGA